MRVRTRALMRPRMRARAHAHCVEAHFADGRRGGLGCCQCTNRHASSTLASLFFFALARTRLRRPEPKRRRTRLHTARHEHWHASEHSPGMAFPPPPLPQAPRPQHEHWHASEHSAGMAFPSPPLPHAPRPQQPGPNHSLGRRLPPNVLFPASVISSSFATCRASCVLHVAKLDLVLKTEWVR